MWHENFYYNIPHNLSALLSFLTIDLDLCLIFILEDVEGKLGQRPVSIYRDLVLGQYVLQAPVVQKVDIVIHRINHYPVDSAIGFPNIYQGPVAWSLVSANRWLRGIKVSMVFNAG